MRDSDKPAPPLRPSAMGGGDETPWDTAPVGCGAFVLLIAEAKSWRSAYAAAKAASISAKVLATSKACSGTPI